jgi:hypothetical protein
MVLIRLIVAQPDRGGQLRCEADEPGILGAVRPDVGELLRRGQLRRARLARSGATNVGGPNSSLLSLCCRRQ